MNQTQRKFLIDKIESNVKKQIDAIKSSDPEQPPSLENYFYGLALTGKLEIQQPEFIKEVMCKKAMNHNSGRYNETWLGSSQGDMIDRANVKLKIRELFTVPKDYDDLWATYRDRKEENERRIRELHIECDTLTTRIQLASDKTLDKMISEIDNMGDISLMDTKLKNLLSVSEQKLL